MTTIAGSLAFVIAPLVIASSAGAASVTGVPETVFDWSANACGPKHIPDLPARALRDDRGRVQLTMSHFVNRRLVGPGFERLQVRCAVTMGSSRNPDPATYDDREWVASLYSADGRDVTALVHEEYQGNRHAGECPQLAYLPCWYNAITFARSTDGGRSFTQPPPPAQLVASLPYPYVPGAGPYGYFQPSNIVDDGAGRYYAMFLAEEYADQQLGTCLMRTRTPGDPSSWRPRGGNAFDISFADPYVDPSLDSTDHLCTPVDPAAIGAMHDSLTYNTHLNRYLLIGRASPVSTPAEPVAGFYYSLSRDLVHWSAPKLLMPGELTQSYQCGDADPVSYPSLVDPDSNSRVFATSGKTAWLYYTQFHYADCHRTLDRDLVKIGVDFSR